MNVGMFERGRKGTLGKRKINYFGNGMKEHIKTGFKEKSRYDVKRTG